jgi:hypothetical protein
VTHAESVAYADAMMADTPRRVHTLRDRDFNLVPVLVVDLPTGEWAYPRAAWERFYYEARNMT